MNKRPFVAVYLGLSLDGFIAREDGGLDWLDKYGNGAEDEKGEDYGFHAFMDSVDILVMGRKTYDKVLSFGSWPYTKRVLVLSRTLGEKDIPRELAGKVSFFAGTPGEVIEELRGVKKVYLDGGQTVQAFLARGLVDEMILTIVPVLLGRGIPLFGSLEKDQPLVLKECRGYKSGLVQCRYGLG